MEVWCGFDGTTCATWVGVVISGNQFADREPVVEVFQCSLPVVEGHFVKVVAKGIKIDVLQSFMGDVVFS